MVKEVMRPPAKSKTRLATGKIRQHLRKILNENTEIGGNYHPPFFDSLAKNADGVLELWFHHVDEPGAAFRDFSAVYIRSRLGCVPCLAKLKRSEKEKLGWLAASFMEAIPGLQVTLDIRDAYTTKSLIPGSHTMGVIHYILTF